MKGWETFGLAAVAVVLLGTPAAVFAGQQYLNAPAHTYTLVGYAVEDGGWTPKEIAVHQGEHVHLRVTSGDVSHGLMVPGLNINVPEIYPGKYTTVDFTPKTAGRYPFMCTVLCSPRHGQMQGAIVVLPAEGAEAPAGVTAGAAPQSEGASGAGQAAASPAGSPRPAASSSAPAAASAAAGPVGSSGPSVSAQPKAAAPQSTSSSASPSAAASPKSSPSAAPSSGSVSAAEIAAGKKVYQTFCLACHGPSAAGGIKMGAVSSADLRSGALNAAFHGDATLIRRAILNGKAASGKDLNIAMPRWQGQLSDAQLGAVISYLEHGT